MRSRISHRRRRNISFPQRRSMAAQNNQEHTLGNLLREKARIVEIDGEEGFDYAEHDTNELNGVPFPGSHLKQTVTGVSIVPHYLQTATRNLVHDDLQTVTSETQAKTTAECLPYVTGKDTQGLALNSHGLPHLRRKAHAEYLRGFLGELPAGYAAMDASRPWLFYWCIAGLSFLGEDVSEYRERLMETVRPLQNASGGFGGGHGQFSHCACSYATILALTAVEGLEVVDRKAMWHWLGQVKQADGGFRMAVGAEEDIRGAYCAMTIITLLNLPLELPPEAHARGAGLQTFTDRLGEWVGRCQTFEGGIAGAPTNEAHGAYAFCALACLSILDTPHVSIPRYLDTQALVRWLASMQTVAEGGFAGRTNKLVDACYSHWVGGCWSLLQAAFSQSSATRDDFAAVTELEPSELWNPAALIRYLLTCCQQPGKKGGMRDKPSARPDAYHTCYSLSGLSAAQNLYIYENGITVDAESGRLTAAFNWLAQRLSPGKAMQELGIDEHDVVECVHPVFVVTFDAVMRAKEQFAKGGL
ncbi:hypothetical protein BAUCODRAFT_403486 [Baudoinia panamericana UAMH 10762]|uniref:Protein farnesyltransferase subunit beta n=1 Tax=Baudoinia panamericana (strain UAMH 10762) TaxID=717646 RepID=M2N1G1_BAUPA|nr:uncharacterized protein BAUCODRAFT_403486 [Baudoinia panamericana UAMH 10762]EMC97778.1 hypothetical protein BAUCODRAFT_403486 [Baudoinia panamericana UAMH 10762]